MTQYRLNHKADTKDKLTPLTYGKFASTWESTGNFRNYKQYIKAVTNPFTQLVIGNLKPHITIGSEVCTKDQPRANAYPRTKESFKDKVNNIVMDIEQSDVCTNRVTGENMIERYQLLTKKDVKKFMAKYYPEFPNYFFVPSTSYYYKGTLGKWHLHILLDKEVLIADIGIYLESKLPDECLVMGRNKNGAAAKRNVYFDNAIYAEPQRPIYEHRDNHRDLVFVGRKVANKTPNFKKIKERINFNRRELFDGKYVSALKKQNEKKLIDSGMTPARAKIFTESDKLELFLSDIIILSNGQKSTVSSIVSKGRSIRCCPPMDSEKEYWSAMSYQADDNYFYDHHSKTTYTIRHAGLQDLIIPTGEFIPRVINPATEVAKKSLIIGETGMGKTTSLENRPKTIILVPRQDQVERYRIDDNHQDGSVWALLKGEDWMYPTHHSICMTYNKFYGHFKNDVLDPGYDIVLDENHFLDKKSKQNDWFLEHFLYSDEMLGAEKVIFTSATPVYDFYHNHMDSILHYTKEGTKKVTYLTVENTDAQLLHIASLLAQDKTVMIYVENKQTCQDLAEDFGGTFYYSGMETPHKIFGNGNKLFACTSVLGVGSSIHEHIDYVLFFGGGKNTVRDLVQKLGRGRVNIPEIFVYVRKDIWGDPYAKEPKFSKYDYAVTERFKTTSVKKRKTVWAISEKSDNLKTSLTKDGDKSISGFHQAYSTMIDSYAAQHKDYREELFNQFGNYEVLYDTYTPEVDVTVEEKNDVAWRENLLFIIPELNDPLSYEDAFHLIWDYKEDDLPVKKAKQFMHDIKRDKTIPLGSFLDLLFDEGLVDRLDQSEKNKYVKIFKRLSLPEDQELFFDEVSQEVLYATGNKTKGKWAKGKKKVLEILKNVYSGVDLTDNIVVLSDRIYIKMRPLNWDKDEFKNVEKPP